MPIFARFPIYRPTENGYDLKHEGGYVAYPLGLKGIVVAKGDTYEQALAEVKSAIQFHLDTFGKDALSDDESPVMEAFIAETGVFA